MSTNIDGWNVLLFIVLQAMRILLWKKFEKGGWGSIRNTPQ